MKQRADGRYCCQIVIGRDENNKKIIKTVYGYSPEEVENKVKAIKTDMGRGVDVAGADTSFKEWAKMFLTVEKLRLNKRVYSGKKVCIEAFYPTFGNTAITMVKPFQVEQVLAHLAENNPYTHKPSSAKTLKEYKVACGQVFKYAQKNRAITFNPCDFASIPSIAVPQNERRALTQKERKWIEECEDYSALPAMIALYAGLRRGEMAALTWDDVDLKNKTITVSKAYDYSNKRVKMPKTKSGIRIVHIPNILTEALKSAPRRSNFVVSLDGGRVTSAQWERMNRDLLRAIDEKHGTPVKVKVGVKYTCLISIRPFGWHDLRHTYATILYEAGVDAYTAKELLGHKDLSTTLKIYTHLSNEQRNRSVSLLESFIDSQVDSQ